MVWARLRVGTTRVIMRAISRKYSDASRQLDELPPDADPHAFLATALAGVDVGPRVLAETVDRGALLAAREPEAHDDGIGDGAERLREQAVVGPLDHRRRGGAGKAPQRRPELVVGVEAIAD